MYSLSTEKKFAVMSGLVEGNSIRSRRVTPAMESGTADHIWNIEELLRPGLAE
jgi:hypothetical protein